MVKNLEMFSANLEGYLPLYYSKIAYRRLTGSCCLCVVAADIPQMLSSIPSLSLSLSQALWLDVEGLSVSGPLKPMNFTVQEGGGPRILHQVIKCFMLSSVLCYPFWSKTP